MPRVNEQTRRMAEDGYITVQQAADLGGIGSAQIYVLAKQARIRTRRIGARWFVERVSAMAHFGVDQNGRPVDSAEAARLLAEARGVEMPDHSPPK